MSRWRVLLVGLLFIPVQMLWSGAALAEANSPSDGDSEARITAWGRSLKLEQQGHVRHARATLLRAWGKVPESYEVTVRIAWLSLRLGEAERAVQYYRRARKLEGAGPEANQGLVSALLLSAAQALAEGDRVRARAAWREALVIDPNSLAARQGLEDVFGWRVDPQLWGAYLEQKIGAFRAAGWAVFGDLPFLFQNQWRIRAAYRHTELLVPIKDPLRFPGQTNVYRQNDVYVGGGFTNRVWGLNVLGLGLFPSTEGPIFGEGASLRFGARFGVVLEEAAVFPARGANWQVRPFGWAWPSSYLRLGAGARLTSDQVGHGVSGCADVLLTMSFLQIDLAGRIGRERWPITLEAPMVLASGQDITLAGTLTAIVPLSSVWVIGAQGEVGRLEAEGMIGHYGSAALGLIWSPRAARPGGA